MLGELIREQRESKGWSKSQLARHSGVNRTTIVMIEKGNTRSSKFDTVCKLSSSLGIRPGEIWNKINTESKIENIGVKD